MTLPMDFYDDPLAALRQLNPGEVATVRGIQVPPRSALDKQAGNRFALVVRTSDGEDRRFPCYDGVSTLLSVAALEANRGHIPPGMAKVASFHLAQAAELYGVRAPTEVGPRVESNVVVGRLPEAERPASSLAEAVGQANWLEAYATTLDPMEVRRHATSIAEALSAAGVPAFGKVAEYSGSVFGSRFTGSMELRKQLVLDDVTRERYAALEAMAEHLGPEKTATGLYGLDKESGLARDWGVGVPDPVVTVFGSPARGLSKQASVSAVDRLRAREAELREVFGPRFVADALRDPEAVIGALPRPERAVFDRIVGE